MRDSRRVGLIARGILLEGTPWPEMVELCEQLLEIIWIPIMRYEWNALKRVLLPVVSIPPPPPLSPFPSRICAEEYLVLSNT